MVFWPPCGKCRPRSGYECSRNARAWRRARTAPAPPARRRPVRRLSRPRTNRSYWRLGPVGLARGPRIAVLRPLGAAKRRKTVSSGRASRFLARSTSKSCMKRAHKPQARPEGKWTETLTRRSGARTGPGPRPAPGARVLALALVLVLVLALVAWSWSGRWRDRA